MKVLKNRIFTGLQLIGVFFLLSSSGRPESLRQEPSDASVVFFLQEYRKDFHPHLEFRDLIFVSIRFQKLYYMKNTQVMAKYDVSTSRYGVGCKANSQKTPVGLHKVRHKIGNGTPINGIIKYGTYAGENARIVQTPEHIAQDLITTRVLWLQGLEPGINQGSNIDSYHRSIYIHGTAEEGLIGRPASHGCVRMRNKDVLHLFNQVPNDAYVLILDH